MKFKLKLTIIGFLLSLLLVPLAHAEPVVVELTVNGENQPVILGLGRQAGLCHWVEENCELMKERSAISPRGRVGFTLPDEEGGEYSIQIALNGSQAPIISPKLKPGLNKWDLDVAIVGIRENDEKAHEGLEVRLFVDNKERTPVPFITTVLANGKAFVFLPKKDMQFRAGIYDPHLGVRYSPTLQTGKQTWALKKDSKKIALTTQNIVADPKKSLLSGLWVNNGEDKVTQDELRLSSGKDVTNIIWDGEKVKLFAAKNEVVALNLVLEAKERDVKFVQVKFNKLQNDQGDAIVSRDSDGNLFNFVGRNIELFFVRYLQIKGVSKLAYNPHYDERHVPQRFRLPFSPIRGKSKGKWEQRPDANKFYPDIAVPIEKVGQFNIAKGGNQSVWADIFIPKDANEGKYKGSIYVFESGVATHEIPVELTVFPFALPNKPTAPTMLYFSPEDVHDRYIGRKWPNYGALSNEAKNHIDQIWYNHHKMAQRHKVSLIDPGLSQPKDIRRKWDLILKGTLFTEAYGYDGPGKGESSGVYSIGTYGGWRRSWKPKNKENMWKRSNAWVKFFENEYPEVEYFLYLLDEPKWKNYADVQRWAKWIDENPGIGSKLPTLATSKLLETHNHMPSVDIAFTWWGDKDKYAPIVMNHLRNKKPYWAYNGHRPWAGSYAIEDEGVAMRTWGWIQYKHSIARWFYWQATAYKNSSHQKVETNVFKTAWTFGRDGGRHEKYGKTGPNYNNGDGVLFYPGTEKRYKEENYGMNGPISSLRLKHWRRGIQDHDYITMAAQYEPDKVRAIVQEMIPKVLWEVGVTDPKDPSYVHADISWSIDPDVWEQARLKLAEIIIEGLNKGNKNE